MKSTREKIVQLCQHSGWMAVFVRPPFLEDAAIVVAQPVVALGLTENGAIVPVFVDAHAMPPTFRQVTRWHGHTYALYDGFLGLCRENEFRAEAWMAAAQEAFVFWKEIRARNQEALETFRKIVGWLIRENRFEFEYREVAAAVELNDSDVRHALENMVDVGSISVTPDEDPVTWNEKTVFRYDWRYPSERDDDDDSNPPWMGDSAVLRLVPRPTDAARERADALRRALTDAHARIHELERELAQARALLAKGESN